ncbi:MAG: HK97 family phage prohead protease, partial [Acidimicrobiales bacterium]
MATMRSVRLAPLSDAHLRAGSGTTAQFVGYASTVAEPYAVHDWLGEYRETIAPGAFKRALASSPNVPLLFNHDGIPVASTGAGTMTLVEDKRGLAVEATLDRRLSVANDVAVALERGDLRHMSFSFSATGQDWNDTHDTRTVRDLDLFDVSVVTNPANPTTTAALRMGGLVSSRGLDVGPGLAGELIASVRGASPSLATGARAAFASAERASWALVDGPLAAASPGDAALLVCRFWGGLYDGQEAEARARWEAAIAARRAAFGTPRSASPRARSRVDRTGRWQRIRAAVRAVDTRKATHTEYRPDSGKT